MVMCVWHAMSSFRFGFLSVLTVLSVTVFGQHHPLVDDFLSTRELDPIPDCIQELTKNSSPLVADHLDLDSSVYSRHSSLLILVESNADRRSWREAVRSSWKTYIQPSTGQAALVFVVPCKQLNLDEMRSLEEESATNRDMVLFFKVAPTMVGSGRLVHYLISIQRIIRYQFILRTHDHFFVQVPKLLNVLEELTDEALYMGYFRGNKTPDREQNWFLCPTLVPHADAGGYIISVTVVNRIVKQFQYLNYYNDDSVSISLWLSSHKDIHYKHSTQFNTGANRGCQNNFIVTPMTSEVHMAATHNRLQNEGNLCMNEFVLEKTYLYDWSALPMNCCKV